jgi:hypothetical protein
MNKNFSDLNFILLVAALFGILTVVHALSRIQRRMATKKLPASIPSHAKKQEPAPSFIRPGINWIKVADLETEEEMAN